MSVPSEADLTAEHDLDQLLERMVRCAAEVVDARYAALGLYDDGRIVRFVHHGFDAATVARIGDLPHGRGLLGEAILTDHPIRLADLRTDPRSCGFPPHHPPMQSFLGVPVRLGDRRLGNLYLTEKRSGAPFDATDERLVATLASFAAAAVEGARARTQHELLGRVIGAQEAERARVARDLHDQIGQALTSVLLGLRLVSDSLAGDRPDAPAALARCDEVRTLVADALAEVRQLAFDLRPTILDDIGLVPAVRRLVRDMSTRHGLSLALSLDGIDDDSRFPPELETVVYRVVQEAVTNVTRHARAAQTSVALSAEPGRLRVSVSDDGVGFEPPRGRPRSLGLAGMTERAALVGGRVHIDSAVGAGTVVSLEVPVG